MLYESPECHRQVHRHTDHVRGERGASVVEYALLVALIAVVCIAAITSFGTETGGSVSRSGDSMFVGN